MTVIDWVIAAILAVSSLISLKRGFIKESLSLASWVVAFVVARAFSGNLAGLLAGSIETDSLRWILAFVILFAGTLVIGALLNHLLSHIIKATGLSGTDRVLGMVFGLVRGGLIILIIVYGLQYTLLSNDDWWKQSTLIPYFEDLANWSRSVLPEASSQIKESANQIKNIKNPLEG